MPFCGSIQHLVVIVAVQKAAFRRLFVLVVLGFRRRGDGLRGFGSYCETYAVVGGELAFLFEGFEVIDEVDAAFGENFGEGSQLVFGKKRPRYPRSWSMM